jgi:hypothetical protein
MESHASGSGGVAPGKVKARQLRTVAPMIFGPTARIKKDSRIF